MKFINQFSDAHLAQLLGLYQQVGWGKDRNVANIQQCIAHSQVCIGIVNQQNVLIGFTRVLSDFTYKAIIFDVIVSSQCRASGLGKKLLNAVKTHPSLKHVKHFELSCLPELIPYYQQFGFSTILGGNQLMRFIND